MGGAVSWAGLKRRKEREGLGQRGGAGGVTQLDALAEDPNSIPSTRIRHHTTTCDCASIHPPLAAVGIFVHMCAHTHTHIIKMRETERPAFIVYLTVDEI